MSPSTSPGARKARGSASALSSLLITVQKLATSWEAGRRAEGWDITAESRNRMLRRTKVLGFRLVVAIAVMWFTAMALISASKTCTSTIHQRVTTMTHISNLKLWRVKFYA